MLRIVTMGTYPDSSWPRNAACLARHVASGASPQAALRGMAAMLCGLRYDESDRLVPLEIDAA